MFTAFCFRAARSDRYRPMRSAAPYKSSGDADAAGLFVLSVIRYDSVTEHCGDPTVTPRCVPVASAAEYTIM